MIRSLTGATVALLPVLLLAAPAGAAEAPVVSVELSDGVDEARDGDVLDYVATVRNEGGAPAAVTVTVTAPPYVSLDGEASWPVELAGGESRQFSISATVGEPAEKDYQVVTTASVAATTSPGTTLVRAVDADAIAGMDAPPSVRGLTETSGTMAGSPVPLILGGAAVIVGVGAAVFFWHGARRRATTR
ncbi:hypothetical protein CLV46_2816 [Diaminobutyricimonas aerilata]|uniref:Repeat protein (TIGR01451 family) n=1 Tax=Diaminobutyricimonas aerilata TaxID=1162967 RepID=A0A2M9CMV9_9MICO|nr:hypothetical protein [Diaminobutyricimonas aerilata]PJJ73230.1 hypothetical protein CLV46_2816 [Diaminobutyricimonas aerilata]